MRDMENIDFNAVQRAKTQVVELGWRGIRDGDDFKDAATVINEAAKKIGYRCRCITCADCDTAFYLSTAADAVLEQRNPTAAAVVE
ncbi:MAG: hypothetical protein V1876_00640 [Candidatus Peregrinibacteria bacterium]